MDDEEGEEEEQQLNLSEVEAGDFMSWWFWSIPDEEMVKFGLLSSFKIALESLSDDPSLKSGNNETASKPTAPLLVLLKLSKLSSLDSVAGTEEPRGGGGGDLLSS